MCNLIFWEAKFNKGPLFSDLFVKDETRTQALTCTVTSSHIQKPEVLSISPSTFQSSYWAVVRWTACVWPPVCESGESAQQSKQRKNTLFNKTFTLVGDKESEILFEMQKKKINTIEQTDYFSINLINKVSNLAVSVRFCLTWARFSSHFYSRAELYTIWLCNTSCQMC